MTILAPLQPTERIADAVYEQLREAVLTGQFPAGSRLSVPSLASELEVSRSPVREAVQRLVKDRLAVEEPRRGAIVSNVSPEELAALYQVREVLEGLAARIAAEHPDPNFISILETTMNNHRTAVNEADWAAHAEYDSQFHSLLRRQSGNSELIRSLDDIQVRVRLGMTKTSVSSGMQVALSDHQAIFDAIKESDGNAAERVARRHISRLRESLLTGVVTGEDANPLTGVGKKKSQTLST